MPEQIAPVGAVLVAVGAVLIVFSVGPLADALRGHTALLVASIVAGGALLLAGAIVVAACAIDELSQRRSKSGAGAS